MDINYSIDELRRDKDMCLVNDDTLKLLENDYIESLDKLKKIENLVTKNDYIISEEMFYKGDLLQKDKINFLKYKNTLEKLQLETNIKQSYYEILKKFKNNQIEYTTFVDAFNKDIKIVSGDEYSIPNIKIQEFLLNAKENNLIMVNIHNHPRNSDISLNDIFLLTNKNISQMHIISGNRIQIIKKLENFESKEFNVLFNSKLRDKIINENFNYTNNNYLNKQIQHNIKNLDILNKNILLEIIKGYMFDKELKREQLLPFDYNSILATNMDVDLNYFYEQFESSLNETLDLMQKRKTLELDYINL